MTKVLILSDSHGLTSEVEKIKQRYAIENIIHCGDSELEMDHPVLKDMINVKGNCDFDANLPYIQQFELNKLNFFVTHGHLHDVSFHLQTLHDNADDKGAQIVCYGHTHVPGVQKIGNILFINPGSIRLPRQRKEKSYAIMEWNNINEIKIEFYTNSGEKIDDLAYSTSLKMS